MVKTFDKRTPYGARSGLDHVLKRLPNHLWPLLNEAIRVLLGYQDAMDEGWQTRVFHVPAEAIKAPELVPAMRKKLERYDRSSWNLTLALQSGHNVVAAWELSQGEPSSRGNRMARFVFEQRPNGIGVRCLFDQ